MSKSEVERYLAVCSDESFEKFRAKLEKEYYEFVSVKLTNQIIEELQKNRQDLFDEKISLDKAYNNVRDYKQKIIEGLEKQKTPPQKEAKKETKPKKKCYISGAISGLDYEYAKSNFLKAEKALQKDYEVINPLKMFENKKLSWVEYLECEIPLLAKCDAINLLSNWESSRGARIERAIAQALGLKIISLEV